MLLRLFEIDESSSYKEFTSPMRVR